MERNHVTINFISKYLYLRRPKVVIFTDVIKIATMFIKTTFKNSKIDKRLRKYVLRCNLYLYFFK